ncbi:tryptophan-rich sensory protein [Halpernia sp.]|uniref:tryptophan-rich sensory protein n=1 Tax=Halpernia sp. TaxID=2782209 RepID=UPI003A952436
MKKTLQILNGVALVSTIIINYISNSGLINGKTIGNVSDGLRTLFTPAGYAFSIWGFIYLLLFGFIIYQGRSLFVKNAEDDFVEKIGPWFIISCVANSSWVFLWLFGYTGLSCIFIFLLLFSLVKIILNNRMEIWNAPAKTIAFLWWPFVFYAGWVTVASIANVSAFLVKINWDGFGISPEIWTITMIIIATIINLIVVYKRNLREFATVGIWALIAIAVPNFDQHQTISYIAIIASIIIFIVIMIQGFQNRKSNPFFKMLINK